MSDENEENAAEEFISEHKKLFDALQDAIDRKDEAAIFFCGERYLRFLAESKVDLGSEMPKQKLESMLAKFDEFSANVAKTMRAKRIEVQNEAEELIEKFGEEFLWRALRQLGSTPPVFKGSAQHRKFLQELAPALEIYAQFLDIIPVEGALRHFRSRLDFYKRMQSTGEKFALSAERIIILENALNEFQSIYEAEQAEQNKFLLAAHEAKRVRKLFDQIDQPIASPVGKRSGN